MTTVRQPPWSILSTYSGWSQLKFCLVFVSCSFSLTDLLKYLESDLIIALLQVMLDFGVMIIYYCLALPLVVFNGYMTLQTCSLLML